MSTPPRIAFFGTPQIAVWVLEELEKTGIVPSLIVTNPDAPVGRKQIMTQPPVATWGKAHGISVFQPTSLKNPDDLHTLTEASWDLFVVVAYGKILPEWLINLPTHKTLNVHPSLLPILRGASPIRSAILGDIRETGVSIMHMDAEMDHGPIVAQIKTPTPAWPIPGLELDEIMAHQGGALLAEVIPKWLRGEITPTEQDHTKATFCTKITKEMGEISLEGDPYQNFLKICAFDGWPGTFFFTEKNCVRMRIKIVDAKLAEDGSLKILRVIPEGKKEMSYEDFIR